MSWKSVECPHCRALPGEPCRSISGRITSVPHAVRYERVAQDQRAALIKEQQRD